MDTNEKIYQALLKFFENHDWEVIEDNFAEHGENYVDFIINDECKTRFIWIAFKEHKVGEGSSSELTYPSVDISRSMAERVQLHYMFDHHQGDTEISFDEMDCVIDNDNRQMAIRYRGGIDFGKPVVQVY